MGQHQLLSITFHYVGMPETAFPGIHGLSASQFKQTIADLKSNWTLVSLNDIVTALDGKSSLPQKACLISLDDGLRCQYETALPILDELKAPAAFFVLGSPYIKEEAASVHQLHYIRATHGDQLLIDLINENVDNTNGVGDINSIDEKLAKQHYRYDSASSAKLKFYLNYKSTPEFTKHITNSAFEKIGTNQLDFIHNYYMTRSMIKEIGSRGYLGSHAETHLPLATLSTEAIKLELRNTREFLEDVTDTEIIAISYPLGNTMAVNRKVGNIARETGHRLGWTMERAINQSLADPLLFGRLDAADRNKIDRFGPRERYIQENNL